MAAQIITIYWRDIPAQITAQEGRRRETALLDARFQHAIDRAAVVAGYTDTDSYIAQWHRESKNCADDLASAVSLEANRVNNEYPSERLERLVLNGGIDETTDPPT